MNVSDPSTIRRKINAQIEAKRRRRRHKFSTVFLILFLSFVLLGYSSYARALPLVTSKTILKSLPAQSVNLNWPTRGEGAIGILGSGVLATSGNQYETPTASVAKIMDTLMILKKYPLSVGEQGPLITITQQDANLYNSYVAEDGSVVPVNVGEQLSEYQALEAMLLPSANNVADMMAVWAYGSMSAYHNAANTMAKNLGMNHTTFSGDASGFLPVTVSTPHDLVLLGQAALGNPVIKQIVSLPSAVIPVAGTIYNVNSLITNPNIVGIKTGNSNQAGGCYLFAATHTLGKKQIIIIGAIMNAPNLSSAIGDALPLLSSMNAGFEKSNVLSNGQVVTQFNVPWSGSVGAATQKNIAIWRWKGMPVKISANITHTPRYAVPADTKVGTVVATSAVDSVTATLHLVQPINAPSLGWRLTHL